ncbi:MAG: glycoside hydrolase family 97 protein [Bacteroidales bacterium]|nr:glycoside hydrolase family 97 protein [Bacteroidales bacterium]
MKKRIWLILMSLSSIGVFSQTLIKNTHSHVISPNGKYVFEVYQKEKTDGAKQLYYTLTYENKKVLEESELGILIENQLFESALGIPNDSHKVWGDNLTFIEKETKDVDTTWKPIYGERSTVQDHYTELVLKYQKGNESDPEAKDNGYDKRRYYQMDVIIRAYNEGIAFRYHFPEATNGLFLHIVGEQTEFSLPEGTMAYYERWAQGPYSLKPLKDWSEECERPLTMKLANGLTVALAEAEMVDYSRMKFKLDDSKANTLKASLYSSVDVITPYSTPWRVVMVGEKPIDLIANNDIILNLNPENKIEDPSWIKPGKVIRATKLKQAEVLKYIDFAAERGLQYVHIDAGWYGPEMKMSSDATKVSENHDLNISAITDYASSKGIGLWVYVNQRALLQQLDELLPLYKKWGIKGIKFGFVQIGNQHWTIWLHDAVRKCAEYGILVDIHDEYRPTGFSRTYPNLLTQEGIRGNEEFPDATHNTILPFTRFLCGAGDYTICYYDQRIKTTHAHQLALSVVYYSPLQFLYWYDNPSLYNGEPEIEFFDKVHTVWDDTKPIDGEIGEFITVARRKGDEWFLGTLGNNDAQRIRTPLHFLKSNEKYVANIYVDDEKIETKTKVRVVRLIVDASDILNFQLKPSGGCAIHFIPAMKEDLKKYKTYKKNQLL